MKEPKIVFLSYVIETSPISANGTGTTLPYGTNKSYGYATALHCNYIQKIQTDDIRNKRVNFKFDVNLFPFMKPASEIAAAKSGYGWTGFRIKGLIQVQDWTGSTTGSTENFKPVASAWKVIDVTDQIIGYQVNMAIHPTGLTTTLFEINPQLVPTYPTYDLSYLRYPNALISDDNKLAFGEEVFFYGNVNTDIEAQVFTTDIAVTLPLNEYNYTQNPTWDGISPVLISEIGIFDDDNNLVALAKTNYPIDKDANKFRSFAINLDF